MQIKSRTLNEGISEARDRLLNYGYIIKTESWQGDNEPPEFLELLHLDLVVPMSENPDNECDPDLPWADLHFEERVSGKPLNPPPSHVKWNTGTENYLSNNDKFSHSYPERLWSKELSQSGIRFDTGDLNTAVQLLKKEPFTRQCYIPIWFPEDLTAAVQGERVPCTFGFHFMNRGGELHCFYPMRSCDAVRHFHNDLYMVNLLCLWLIEKSELDIKPRMLHFSATSFHCFTNDKFTLRNLIK